ncbi:MAG: spondin domain-containing protein [Pseudomonadales bacterium]
MIQRQFGKTLSAAALSAVCLLSGKAMAADVTIEVINLTRGSWFTPLLVAAHVDSTRLFTSGTAASTSLQAMAEGGSIDGLAADLTALNASMQNNPASGLMSPGSRTSLTLNNDDAPDNTQLPIVGMILPSNDGFLGLNGITIPSEAGRYVFNVNAYDAGTEANDEILGSGMPGAAGFPAPPPVAAASGTGGTGVNASVEGYVHIHRNVLGDDDMAGGVSDIVNTVQRWLNPVARVIVTVN